MGRGAQYSFVRHLLAELSGDARDILELGCGAAVYRPIFRSKNYVATDIPNPRYQSQGDVDVFASAPQLPFSPRCFDFVFAQAALDCMPQLPLVLAETYRVLRPAGRLLVITYRKDVLERIHRESLRQGIPHYGIYAPSELIRWMQHAGFAAQEIPRPPIYDGGPLAARLKSRIATLEPFGTALRRLSHWRIFLGAKTGSL
ncbi:MAG TPA: methyltransferase domain-containing protein [Bryobacterales bacterium]|nr:methyltransferase domain-containing protein [Bryobacterales bacterium]